MIRLLRPRQRLDIAIAMLCALLVGGTVGYRYIEGWSWFDSLYHTVITLATIGYAETHPLSTAGRAFTIVLVLLSLVFVALSLQAMASIVVAGDIEALYWRRRMTQGIGKLTNHVVLCGYGLTGRRVAVEMKVDGAQFVVIEKDAERLRAAVEDGHLAVEGDATSDDVLRDAGIERARAAVVALSSDADNVFATLSLRLLNKSLRIVSRFDEESTREKLLRAGADDVVSPKMIGGHRLATLVLRPATAGFLDAAMFPGQGLDLRFDEFALREGSQLVGRPLAEIQTLRELGVRVVAIIAQDSAPAYLPGPRETMPPGATIVVVGRSTGVEQLRKREGATR